MAFLQYEPRQVLHHYCSPDGLEGLLSSRRIWFSDLESLNDPREIQLGFEHFLSALKDVRHTEYAGHRGFPLSLLAGRLARAREVSRCYCCCFSLDGDGLPLWNEYTNHRGVCVGFRPSSFRDLTGRIQRVEYLNSQTAQSFRAKALELARLLIGETQARTELDWIAATVDAYASITSLKHSSWSHEKEIRMVYMQGKEPLPPEDELHLTTEDGEEYEWIRPLARMRGDTTVHYVALPFGRKRDGENKHRRAIATIRLGPKCPLTEEEIGKMLADNGYEGVMVLRSDCQIR